MPWAPKSALFETSGNGCLLIDGFITLVLLLVAGTCPSSDNGLDTYPA